MVKKIIILGTGGNCIDILETINKINKIKKKYKILGFLDDDTDKVGLNFNGIKVLGALSTAKNYKNCYFVNGIGSPNNFWKKKDILKKTNLSLKNFETIIHPTAFVSKFSKIEKGVVILANVTVASNVSIGKHTIILPNSVINHNDNIGDYVSIASGVCIARDVTIKHNSYIGSGSTIIGNIVVAKNSLVGMGSVVLNSTQKNSVYIGNPARFLRNLI